MSESNIPLSEAIIFFKDEKVSKTMLYSEFEAVLDGMTGVQDCAGEDVRAAYVAVDNNLWVRSCTLFKLHFTKDGIADRQWNIPIRHLAEVAGPGPDLGAGRIHLACKSQCPVNWHASNMWDPDVSSSNNHLKTIQKIIKKNPLHIQFDQNHMFQSNDTLNIQSDPRESYIELDELMPPKLDNIQTVKTHSFGRSASKENSSLPTTKNVVKSSVKQEESAISPELRVKLARTLKKQRFQINTLKNERNDLIARLKFDTQKQKANFEKEQTKLKGCMDVLQYQNDALKDQINALQGQIVTHEKVTKDRLQIASEDKKLELGCLKAQLEEQYKLKNDEEIAQLKEQIQAKELKILYQNEVFQELQSELDLLKRKKLHSLDSDPKKLLEKMQNLGLSFIAYHPGAGHVSIPLNDMHNYMENPTAYIAAKCLVSEAQYQRWLSHYNNPVCMYHTVSGQQCGLRIGITDTPSQFIEGHSDRCMNHKISGQQDNVAYFVKGN